jgi:hypothetical protein
MFNSFKFSVFILFFFQFTNTKQSLSSLRDKAVSKATNIAALECDACGELHRIKKNLIDLMQDQFVSGNIVKKNRLELDTLLKQLHDLEEQFSLIVKQLKSLA